MNEHERKVPELLAPAGGPAQFNAALAAGADAIYCGYGTTFNARRGAQSFGADTFGEACRRAHVVGARVYVTVNVVVRDDELPSVLALVRRAWLMGADAFIVQDWGLLREVRRLWPEVECHVSTQANVHDARAVAWCRKLGVSRVTLSRELSLPEIARIAEEGVELECFGHGALCFCYSGICQLSSCEGDRSANRGACAQPCRLPYELVDEEGRTLSVPGWGRPLCPKDFCTLDDVEALARAGVGSLKVEGRLKGADYVYAVVSAYRAQLDDLAAGRPVSDADALARHTLVKRAFNRDFTRSYLVGASDNDMMSYERSNNRGELVGQVVDGRDYGSVKVRRSGSGGGRERVRTAKVAELDIRLDKPVDKGDLLEVRPASDPSQFLTTYADVDAPAGELITCRTTRTVERGSLVRVIRSQRAMEASARTSELAVPRKRAVRVAIRARLGEPFEVALACADGVAHAVATGFVVEPARTRAVSADELAEHVGRMGATFFESVAFDVQLDEGCGMAFSAVHKVRAHACELLEEALLRPYAERTLSAAPSLGALQAVWHDGMRESEEHAEPDATVQVCACVANAECARAARAAGATRVYATPDALCQGEWPQGVIPVLDEVCREIDHARLDAWVRAGMPVAVGNVSELVLAHERGACAEVRTCVPVHNQACLVALAEAGARGAWLSAELSLAEVDRIAQASPVPVGLVVLGRTRAMTTEHCVLQVADRCVHDCARCKLRMKGAYLKGDPSEPYHAGKLYPVRTDLQGRSRVYAARVLDTTPQIPQLMAMGVSRFAADCTLLATDETSRAVRRVVRAVEAAQAGRRPAERLKGATSGHLFEPIG